MLCNVLSKMVEVFVLISCQWLSVVVSIGLPCWLNMASSELQFAKICQCGERTCGPWAPKSKFHKIRESHAMAAKMLVVSACNRKFTTLFVRNRM